MDAPIVGCESVMAPMPPLKFRGKLFVKACIKRTWFDKNYVAVDFWRQPTEEEWNTLSEQKWEKKLAEEFRKVQAT